MLGGRSNRSNDDVWINTAGSTNSNAGLKTVENCCTKHETERGEKENIIYARALAKKTNCLRNVNILIMLLLLLLLLYNASLIVCVCTVLKRKKWEIEREREWKRKENLKFNKFNYYRAERENKRIRERKRARERENPHTGPLPLPFQQLPYCRVSLFGALLLLPHISQFTCCWHGQAWDTFPKHYHLWHCSKSSRCFAKCVTVLVVVDVIVIDWESKWYWENAWGHFYCCCWAMKKERKKRPFLSIGN